MDIKAKIIALTHINIISAPPVSHTTYLGYGIVSWEDTLIKSRLQATLYNHITHKALVTWIGKHSDPTIKLKYIKIQ